MRPRRVDARVEGRVRALEDVEREGADEVRRLEEVEKAREREGAEGRRELGPVDEGEAFLRLENRGRKTRLPQRVGGRHAPAAEFGLAFPDERERQVRERGQIARRADGALLRHDRVDARLEAREEELERRAPDSREPLREAVRAQEHHRADGGRAERGARPRRMAPHEVELELAELLAGDHDVGEPAEARRHPVDDPVLRDGPVDDGPRGVHAPGGARRERRRRVAGGDAGEIFE